MFYGCHFMEEVLCFPMLKKSVLQYDNQFYNVELYSMTWQIQKVIYEERA